MRLHRPTRLLYEAQRFLSTLGLAREGLMVLGMAGEHRHRVVLGTGCEHGHPAFRY